MGHMRISGYEPSSMILSQRNKYKKLKSDAPKSVILPWTIIYFKSNGGILALNAWSS